MSRATLTTTTTTHVQPSLSSSGSVTSAGSAAINAVIRALIAERRCCQLEGTMRTPTIHSGGVCGRESERGGSVSSKQERSESWNAQHDNALAHQAASQLAHQYPSVRTPPPCTQQCQEACVRQRNPNTETANAHQHKTHTTQHNKHVQTWFLASCVCHSCKLRNNSNFTLRRTSPANSLQLQAPQHSIA